MTWMQHAIIILMIILSGVIHEKIKHIGIFKNHYVRTIVILVMCTLIVTVLFLLGR